MDNRPRPMPKWARALLQSALVAAYLLLAFFAVYRFHSKLAIVSLAASAFIAFGFPEAHSARPRFLVGGYVCGVAFGAACCFGYGALPAAAREGPYALIGFCVLSVFLTSLAMILLDLQHPPACALAASMVLETSPLAMAFTMLVCIVVLCGARQLVLLALGKRLPRAGKTAAAPPDVKKDENP